MIRLSRRNFIIAAGTAAGGGALLIGVPLLRRLRPSGPQAPPLGDAAWIRISPDDTVTVISTIGEMGQGAMSGLLQVLADELDADWKDIRFELGRVDDAYYGRFGYYTAGSNSTRKRFPVYRDLGATARAMLIAAAADIWEVPREECVTDSGSVSHSPSGRVARYGALAAAASRQAIPAQVRLKTRDQWRLIGKPLSRLDVPQKVDGSALYAIDVTLPGLLHGAVRHCPVPGGRLGQVEKERALSVAGVRQVIVFDDAVAVLADGYWQATKGLAALQPEWDIDPSLQHSSTDLATEMDAALMVPAPGDPPSGTADDDVQVSAVYEVPMLAQAPLEPTNATARVGAAAAEIWAPSQEPHGCRAAVAEALGLNPEAVTVHRPLMGGGFGRRLVHDHAVEAALIAKMASAPVKIVWSREEDFLRTTVRPSARMRLRATLEPDGAPSGLRIDSVTLGFGREGVSFEPLPYRVGQATYHHAQVSANVRVGAWRSVDASFDIFFLESFIDECAARAQQDSVEYRLRLLDAESPLRKTLVALQGMCDYVPSRDAARPIGFACFSGLDSHISLAIELEQSSDTTPIRVAHVWCAVDCGLVVNPALVRAQIEGGVLFALSATLGERITLKDGQIEQQNFAQYPLLRFAAAPDVAMQLLDDSGRDPGGAGELAGPVVAPALANALARLQGRRQRSLPLHMNVSPAEVGPGAT